MKPKILVTREVFDGTLAFLAQSCDVESNQADKAFSPEDLARRLADKEGVVCCLTDAIDAKLLTACPGLKAVSNVAVGYNNIDVAACTAQGIMVTNTPGVLDDSTADFAWALLMAAARRVAELDVTIRAGLWTHWQLKQWMGIDIHGATLGIIGMGRIGQAIAKRAIGFDMPVLYCNRSRLAVDVEQRLNATWVTKDELLAGADFVVLQLPYSRETHHLIGAAELATMKPSSILINTARGGVVDDAALVDALRVGRIRAAGLDVFEGEPKLHSGFLSLNNAVLAPHVASSTDATRARMAMTAAKNLVAALTGVVPPNLLNPVARK
ncbi:MAG: D-glycerate dehydrogenase [Betaproteobacteria bacterium]|nr:D-glycerate dehydrogenase [Betaproteobacteria bacterium]